MCGSSEFQPDPEHLYDVLTQSYNFDDILYLSVNTSNPHIDLEANRANLQYALKDWLNQSSENDLIFIYITSHGGGYRRNTPGWPEDEGKPPFIPDPQDEGHWAQIDSDEGFEFTEADIREDVDSDGVISNATWVGADECLFCIQRVERKSLG